MTPFFTLKLAALEGAIQREADGDTETAAEYRQAVEAVDAGVEYYVECLDLDRGGEWQPVSPVQSSYEKACALAERLLEANKVMLSRHAPLWPTRKFRILYVREVKSYG